MKFVTFFHPGIILNSRVFSGQRPPLRVIRPATPNCSPAVDNMRNARLIADALSCLAVVGPIPRQLVAQAALGVDVPFPGAKAVTVVTAPGAGLQIRRVVDAAIAPFSPDISIPSIDFRYKLRGCRFGTARLRVRQDKRWNGAQKNGGHQIYRYLHVNPTKRSGPNLDFRSVENPLGKR